MFDVYDYFDTCRENGLTSEEALQEFERNYADYEESRIEELEERQLYYAYQQDLIDMHRYER